MPSLKLYCIVIFLYDIAVPKQRYRHYLISVPELACQPVCFLGNQNYNHQNLLTSGGYLLINGGLIWHRGGGDLPA